MKKTVFSVMAVLITAFVFLGIKASAKEVKNICVYGDSIPAGYGLESPSENFVNKLAEEYLLRDLGKLTDTLLDFRWLFLIGAALLTAGVFFMSAKALDRPMDDTKPAKNGEKGAVS